MGSMHGWVPEQGTTCVKLRDKSLTSFCEGGEYWEKIEIYIYLFSVLNPLFTSSLTYYNMSNIVCQTQYGNCLINYLFALLDCGFYEYLIHNHYLSNKYNA